MRAPNLTCEKCGRLDSTLRLLEFSDGSRGVWCEPHARIEKRLAAFFDQPQGFGTPASRTPAWQEEPRANAELLADVARELRRRGETAEAEKAEASAASYARDAEGDR